MHEVLKIKDRLLSSLGAENLTAVLLLGGTTCVVLLFLWYLKRKINKSHKHPMKFLSSVFILIFIMPIFFVAFVLFYTPQHAIKFPPDLLTGSIILGGLSLFYSVIKLTKTSARILRQEASRKRTKKLDSEQKKLIDTFTGLYNRDGFVILTEHNMRLAVRNKSKVLMLYVKIERLKQLHDKLGYQARDMAILETSKLMTSSFRDSDIIARVNEDTFLIFLVGCTKENTGGVISHFQNMYDAYNAKGNKKHRAQIRYCIVDYSPQFNYKFDNIIAHAEDLLLLQTDTSMTGSAVKC